MYSYEKYTCNNETCEDSAIDGNINCLKYAIKNGCPKTDVQDC